MIRKVAATSMLAMAAVAITSATAYADPAPAPPSPNSSVHTDILPGVHYTANVVDNSVVIRTDGGSLITKGTQFQVLDGQGQLLAGVPLTYQRDGKEWPIAARVEGNVATLTPSTDPGSATPLQKADLPLRPVASEADILAALGVAATEIGLAMAVGTLLGTLIGGGAGCVAGALLGAAIMPPLFLPGAAGGCLAGFVSGGTLGAMVGTLVFGIPVATVAAFQFFNALNAPPAPAG